MQGIDVSSNNHQGEVFNWQQVKAAGYDFVYVKATQGVLYTNPYLVADVRDAFNAGLRVGVYHFFDGTGTPEEQAAHFNADGIHQPVGDGTTGDLSQFLTLKPVLDYEDDSLPIKQTDVTRFNDALARSIGLYINRSFLAQLGGYCGCAFGWLAWPEWTTERLPTVTAIVQTAQQKVQGIGEKPDGTQTKCDIDVLVENISNILDSNEPIIREGIDEVVEYEAGGQVHVVVFQPDKNRTVHYWQTIPGTATAEQNYDWHSEVLPEPA